MAEIKFCGLTREADAEQGVALGAAYTGVIFAGGPRNLTAEKAAEVLATVPETVKRVGVFADQAADEILRVADRVRLAVIQLHGAFSSARVADLRRRFPGEIWSVCRVAGNELPDFAFGMAQHGDGVLLDAMVAGKLGGTGVTIPWAELSSEVRRLQSATKVILAGGLRPENVADAIVALHPDVVDVSSGVESAPGIKDPTRMRAFRDAVIQISTLK